LSSVLVASQSPTLSVFPSDRLSSVLVNLSAENIQTFINLLLISLSLYQIVSLPQTALIILKR